MAALAKSASVNATNKGERVLLVDGEPFPWHVIQDGVSVSPVDGKDGLYLLTTSIIVDGPIHLWGNKDS